MLERGRPELQWSAILAGVAGNVMEWYDFSVYGYFAVVIGRRFFPAEDPIASLLAAFGAFAAGLFMCPFGSLVFSHIGDKIGRKAALTTSVALMAVPTFLIGLLPTYEQIGPIASALLVLLRLVQGLSVGGEIGISFTFLVEHSAPRNRGFLGSFGPFGVYGGILSGSAVGGSRGVSETSLNPAPSKSRCTRAGSAQEKGPGSSGPGVGIGGSK
jgi:MFS transporter, MHS family, proline/betaine transporter